MNYNSIFESYFGIKPIDRFNTLKYTNGCSKNLQIDLEYKSDLTLNEIINNRAQELSKYDNLILFWSGGIDSTTVFYSLINNNVKFEIVLSKDSEKEYKNLYDKILNKEFSNIKDILFLENYVHKYVKDKTILTGEIGDQIMGSMKYLDYTIDNLKDPFYKHVPDEIIEYFGPSCQMILKDEEATLSEYLWALNFIFKYNDVIYRFPTVLNYLDVDKNNTLIGHFFNTKDFQSWSIQNYKEHCNFDKIEDYKKLFKKYIFESNGDEEYFNNKLKVPSLTSTTIKVS